LRNLHGEKQLPYWKSCKLVREAIYECLLGVKPNRLTRRTIQLKENHKGIFGNCRAFYSVIETQGRLSLHSHMVIWAGLSSTLLQKCSPYPELVSEVSKVLESQFVAHLPAIFHYRSLLRLVTDPKDRPPLSTLHMSYNQPLIRTLETLNSIEIENK